MTYQVLARKYRPSTFDDVVGQDHVIRPLVESIKNDRLAHAYIFSGPRGIGKTTTARLLAMAVNCEESLNDGDVEPCNECDSCQQISSSRDVDVVEIDGASNNSVDQVRELRENARYAPTRNEKKIYIIDEVHMLSRAAFNALLKILEEPPEHVIFVFATTEIEQLPDTILSRCQRFDFRLISAQKIVQALQDICEKESIDVEEEALYLIAKFAEGSLRDAQSILDQMINMAGAGQERLTEELISDTWGIASYDRLVEFLESISAKKTDSILDQLSTHLENGNDLMALISDLAEMMRNCILLQETGDEELLEESLPRELIPKLRTIADELRSTELSWMFDELIDLHKKLKGNSRFQRELAEIGLIRITEGRPKYNLGEITEKLEAISENEDIDKATENNSPPSRQTGDNGKKKNIRNNSSDPVTTEPDDPVTDKSDIEQNTADDDRSPEPSSTEYTDFGARWDQVLEVVSGPAKAYLLSAEEVEETDGIVKIGFLDKYRNHVDRLKKDKFQREIIDAIEEVTGESFELQIEVIEETIREPAPESDDDQPDDESESSNDLVEETKEIFDVDELEPLD